MAGWKWSTAGESHGSALVGILEGLPAGLELDVARIDMELARRQGGYGRGGRMRIESDRVEVLAGLRAGRTLGSPLALLVQNRDATIEDLPVPGSPRPGHADLTGCQRMAEADPRAVLERASARETAMRVALGGAARQVLESFGVRLVGHVVELAGQPIAAEDQGLAARLRVGQATADEAVAVRSGSDFNGLDPGVEDRWRAAVDEAKAEGDTLGGVFEVVVTGLVPGLGGVADPRDRLTGRLAGALLSIPALKGVEVGLGFEAARRRGSELHDAIVPPVTEGAVGPFGSFARASNRSGGLEGGMTTGAPLVVRAAMKPISTLRKGLDTVAFGGGGPVRSTYQRSDVCAVPAASVVGEAVVALELCGAMVEAFGGASMRLLAANLRHWEERAQDL
ncbi:MAG: chorismate synthase [Planctomycetota bacterium]|nr:chorismate synthase [Planctomycetota bacterium]